MKNYPKIRGCDLYMLELAYSFHLAILNNLENSNTEFIKLGMSQVERIIKLNEYAKNKMEILKNNKGY